MFTLAQVSPPVTPPPTHRQSHHRDALHRHRNPSNLYSVTSTTSSRTSSSYSDDEDVDISSTQDLEEEDDDEEWGNFRIDEFDQDNSSAYLPTPSPCIAVPDLESSSPTHNSREPSSELLESSMPRTPTLGASLTRGGFKGSSGSSRGSSGSTSSSHISSRSVSDAGFWQSLQHVDEGEGAGERDSKRVRRGRSQGLVQVV